MGRKKLYLNLSDLGTNSSTAAPPFVITLTIFVSSTATFVDLSVEFFYCFVTFLEVSSTLLEAALRKYFGN